MSLIQRNQSSWGTTIPHCWWCTSGNFTFIISLFRFSYSSFRTLFITLSLSSTPVYSSFVAVPRHFGAQPFTHSLRDVLDFLPAYKLQPFVVWFVTFTYQSVGFAREGPSKSSALFSVPNNYPRVIKRDRPRVSTLTLVKRISILEVERITEVEPIWIEP